MGLALSPHMVSRLQWPSVFYVFGFIGIFWFLAWEKNASSSPAVDNKISKEERDYITSQTIKQVGETIILQRGLLYWTVCVVCIVWIVCKFCTAYLGVPSRQLKPVSLQHTYNVTPADCVGCSGQQCVLVMHTKICIFWSAYIA